MTTDTAKVDIKAAVGRDIIPGGKQRLDVAKAKAAIAHVQQVLGDDASKDSRFTNGNPARLRSVLDAHAKIKKPAQAKEFFIALDSWSKAV